MNNLKQSDARMWMFLVVGTLMTLLVVMNSDSALDGKVVQMALERMVGWINNNLGMLPVFFSLVVGAMVTSIKKDWSWFIGALALSVGMGILIGIVHVSFTATI